MAPIKVNVHEIEKNMFEFALNRVRPLVRRAMSVDSTVPEAGVSCYLQGLLDAMQIMDKITKHKGG
jgi:hypothetical protein